MNNGWGVIFDVDGTMVNNTSYHRDAWIELGRRYHIPITPEYYSTHLHARTNEAIVDTIFSGRTTPDFVHRVTDEKEKIYRKMYRPAVKESPGLGNLLRLLAGAQIPCAVASNSPPENIEMVLSELNLRDHFRCVLSEKDVRAGKPDPELFYTAARELNVSVERCLIFEDSASGFKAAERANAPYIAMTHDSEDFHISQAGSARLICENFEGLDVEKLEALVS